MRYRNVSGHDRVLMVTPSRGVKVAAGDVVEVSDQGAVKGLVGQEVLWEPVAEPVEEEE